MNMGGADKKRIREDQESSPPEDPCRQKQARLMEFEAGMTFDKAENAGAGNENLPEFCLLSNEYSMLLKDPWSWEESAGFGIRNMAAIRKQSYILDYLQDSTVDNSREKEVAEQPKLQVEEDCLTGSFFEATDDQLWRPQSPLPNKEPLFSLDYMGSHDYTTMLQDGSVAESAASCFRIWEQDDDHKDEKNHADGISFLYGSGVSDWIWGPPLNQSQFSESVEIESSMPSL
uniref:Uncharacterized protein n=1 Tax=Picea sitchensis TaxID=3332 RepID=C0PT67_PICSI|nr:unknown [Picea sitchensis]